METRTKSAAAGRIELNVIEIPVKDRHFAQE